MLVKQIQHGSLEYERMVELRTEILRKPLGLFFSENELKAEKDDILIGAFDNAVLIGCCILSVLNNDHIKLRQMAVLTTIQKKGIGSSIISFAENLAQAFGYEKIILHAREGALAFYEKVGYKTTGNSFEEVTITHYPMEKIIL